MSDLPSEDQPPGGSPAFNDCPCGRPHEEHEDYEIANRLKAALELIVPGKPSLVAYYDDNDVGIVAFVSSDAQAIGLLTAALLKIAETSTDGSDLPIKIIPLTDPDLN